MEALSDNDADFDSDDDIVGEAVYDEEYLRKRKQRRKTSSSSEGDEEYHYEEENEEEEEEEESLSASEDSDQPRKVKKMTRRTRREIKLRTRSVGDIQSGLRRSKRATRSRINYGQYDLSESEPEINKVKKTNGSDEHTDASENGDYSVESQGSDNEDDEEEDEDQEMKVDQPDEVYVEENIEEEDPPPEKLNSPDQDETDGASKRRFLDLNELAPGSGFDDAPTTEMKDDTDEF